MLIFARVAAVQNLSAVGLELGLTPGTISKRIQALEEELSVRLFERTTRSIRITDEGNRFLVSAERILAEMDEARATVATTAAKPKGRLRVAASHALGRNQLGPAVLTFLDQYPEIDIHIDFTDRVVNLQEDAYDVAIYSGVLADSALMSKRLAADRIIVAAAPSYLSAYGTPSKPEDLGGHACLVHGETGSWSFRVDGVDSTVRVGARLRSDTYDMLRAGALAGKGLLRASEIYLQDDLVAGQLVPVLDDYPIGANAAIWGVYPSGRHVLPRLRVFLDFLAAHFKETGSRQQSLNLQRRMAAE